MEAVREGARERNGGRTAAKPRRHVALGRDLAKA